MHQLLLFVVFALVVGCGGSPEPNEGEVTEPSNVGIETVKGGVWVHVPDVGSPQIFQFLNAEEARSLYGGGFVRNGNALIDDDLERFGTDDAILIEFRPNAVVNLFGTRVADGKVGFSRATALGFEAPYELEITAFRTRTSMTIGGDEYRWYEDCRWALTPWIHWNGTNLDAAQIPWVSGAFTRSGDVLLASQDSGLLAQVGACPVETTVTFGLNGRPQIHPYRDTGIIGFDATDDGLRVTRFIPGEEPNQELISSVRSAEVLQVSTLGADSYVLLTGTPSILSSSGEIASQRVAISGTDTAELQPLPALDEENQLKRLRLTPGGKAYAWVQVQQDASSFSRVLMLEEDAAWRELKIDGTSQDGVDIDLGEFSVNVLTIAPHDDGTVYAVVDWEDVRPVQHPRQISAAPVRALVRLRDGDALVHPLPALATTVGATLELSPQGLPWLLTEWEGNPPAEQAASTWRGNPYSGNNSPELTVSTMLEDGTVVVTSAGATGRPGAAVFDTARFFNDPTAAGTAFLSIPHMTFTEDIGLVVTNGWNQVRGHARDQARDAVPWRIVMTDAPSGASVRVIESGQECTETCEFEDPIGTIVGIELTTPSGWIADGPLFCASDRLDAGDCGMMINAAGDELELRYSRTPALAANVTHALLLDPAPRADGVFSTLLNVFDERPLPDGSFVPSATTTQPGTLLSLWTEENFEWAWYQEDIEIVAHGVVESNVVAVVRNAGVATQTLGDLELEPQALAALDLSGELGAVTDARLLELDGFSPQVRVLSDGRLALSGRAEAGSVLGNTEVVHAVVVLSGAQIQGEWTQATNATTTSHLIEAAGGAVFALVDTGGPGQFLITFSAAGALSDAVALDWTVDSTAVNLRNVRLGTSDTDVLFALQIAGGRASFGGEIVDLTSPGILSGTLSGSGAVGDLLVFEQTEQYTGEDAVRSVSSLGDVRVVVASAGSLSDEVIFMQGQEPITIGERARGSDLNGFQSLGLFGLATGEALWLTRGWSDQFRLRPFSTGGGLIMRLDPAQMSRFAEVMVRRP